MWQREGDRLPFAQPQPDHNQVNHSWSIPSYGHFQPTDQEEKL